MLGLAQAPLTRGAPMAGLWFWSLAGQRRPSRSSQVGAAAGVLAKGRVWGGVLAGRIGPIARRLAERVLDMKKQTDGRYGSRTGWHSFPRGHSPGLPGMDLVAGPRKLGAWHGAGSGEGGHRARRLLPDVITVVDPVQATPLGEATAQSSSLISQSRRRWPPSRAGAAIRQATGQPRRLARPPGP